ncbi:MAG: transketolase [Oscillospiraceae bacterium]|nr:transketolase [Oscillospiraceae bacterium]
MTTNLDILDINNIINASKEIRKLTVECIAHLGVGHIGGCLSIADLLAVLYYSAMNIDPKDPNKIDRDRLIVSKGHAGPAVYAALASRGYFDKSELKTLNKINTNLPSHCDMNKTPGIDMTTGSLGQGFSCAVGIAIASKLKQDGAYIFSIIGDGESQEGQIWEAAMYSAHKKLDNLIAFTDNNKFQIDGETREVNSVDNLFDKWLSFGWDVHQIDGHNILQIFETVNKAKKTKNQPSMIILDTIKGKGISFVENAGVSNHNMKISQEQLEIALKELI